MPPKKPKGEEPKKKGGAPKGNAFALGNSGGRPPVYETPESLQAKIDEYFEHIKGERGTEITAEGEIDGWSRPPEPVTITGLALYLGFCSRQSLFDYQEKQEFSYIIRRARARVENGYEKALHFQSPTGAIFALKNMGWSDKTENVNTNHNTNYNSVAMSKEEMQDIAKALENEY